MNKLRHGGINVIYKQLKEMFFGEPIYLYLVNFVGKLVYLDFGGEKLNFNSI